MARPENFSDIKDRTLRVATFEVDKLTALPALLKHYVALVESVQKMGGEVNTSYGSTVEVTIPKNPTQLKETFEREQREWDRQEELYAAVLRGEVLKSYQEYGVTEWAKNEGHPKPVFNKEDEDSNV
jgi:hypothetical protein